MFISFSKVIGKVGGFRIGLSKRITSKNMLWASLLYLTVVMFQLMWYSALLIGWLLYAFVYGVVLVTKKLFNILSGQVGKLKATIILAVVYTGIILVLILVSSPTKESTAETIPTATSAAVETVEVTEAVEATLSIELIAGEPGEYGELFTINKDTEFEETYYIYRIPSGTYTVTNSGEYMNQFNVYSGEVHVTEDGWEEFTEAIYVKALDVGQSDTFTITDGQCIEIHEPAKFTIELVG